ncbi:MAG: MarR family transcriptional regulator [Rhodobacteraceae bacterium]|nr:MarR family transcriptional regulator [Paracoccaceae bacterium]
MQLESFFPYKLAVVAEGFSRQLMAVYSARFGLTREEWRLLFLLARARQMDSLELARRTTLDKVQVSRASARLEGKGLISRAVSDLDRRLRVYTITPEGAALFDQVLPAVQARASAITDRLTQAERAALERGLAALERAIGAEQSATDAAAE